MKTRRAIGTVGLILGLASVLLPAWAACGSAQQVTTISVDNRSHVWTDGWPVIYYMPGIAPLAYPGNPPITAKFSSVYWALGSGDTTYGMGDDSGQYPVPPASWVYWNYLAPGYPYLLAAKVFGTWAQSPTIDGCVHTHTCECLLMTDERDGIGYFAAATARTDAGGNAFFVQHGTDPIGWASPIILRAIPRPRIIRYVVDWRTNTGTFTVTVLDPVGPAEGVYELDGCDCGPHQFIIYEQRVWRGAPPPVSRDAADGWEAATPPTNMGEWVSFELSCVQEWDVYLAVGLVFDSGFPASPYKVTLSENSYPFACGPTIADPVELQPRERHRLRELPRAGRDR
jgi:hypothetical protein